MKIHSFFSFARIFFVAVAVVFSCEIQAQTIFSGEYTIGGTSGVKNYPTIVAAANALSTGVVTDKTTFKIRPGTYSGKISILPITGTSSTRTVTFQSESEKASDVIVTAPGGGTVDTNSYTMQFKGASFITLRNLTIVNTAASRGNCVNFLLAANNDSIVGCTFILDSIGTGGFLYGIVAVGGTILSLPNGDTAVIVGNTFIGGNVSVQWAGNNVAHDHGLVVSNNTCRKFNLAGIYSQFNDIKQISGNTIEGRTAAGRSVAGYGIELVSSSSDFELARNTVKNIGIYGISISNAIGTNGALIANNMVAGGFDPSVNYGIGLVIGGSSNLNVYYNTILYDGGFFNFNGDGSSAASITGSTTGNLTNAGIHVVNNIFCNLSGDYAYYVGNAVTLAESDYNDLYTTGQYLGDYNNSDNTDLAAFQAASGKDANSISLSPIWLAPGDVHTFDPALNAKGTPLPTVPKDIDGQTRNATTPDIGADEFTPKNIDMKMLLVGPPVLLRGPNIVTAVLKNEGLSSLKDSTVTLSYSSDGGATWSAPESFTPKHLTAFNTTELFTFADTMKITGSGPYTIRVRINPPGVKNDADRSNDSSLILACVGTSGTYTVGGTTPDFATIADAIASIGSCGVAGPITFNVRTGVYSETVRIPAFLGSSPTNTITIESETGNAQDVVVVSTSTSVVGGDFPAAFILNGAKYVTLKNISISNINLPSSIVVGIQLKDGASYNTITGCTILVDTTPPGNYRYIGIAFSKWGSSGSMDNVDAHHNLITGNTITSSAWGVWIRGKSSAIYSSGNVITNNTINSGNVITTSYSYGIEADQQDSILIRDNTLLERSSVKDNYGVYVSDVSNAVIDANFIKAGAIGIYLTATSGSGSTLVSNNMIAGGFNASSTFPCTGIGLLNNCNNVNIYNNSVLVDKFSSVSFSAAWNGAVMVSPNSNANIRIYNNILCNTGGGYAYSNQLSAAVVGSNQNDLFTTSARFAYWGNVDDATLEDFQTTSATDDSSLSVDPQFLSLTNLHTFNSALDGKAAPFAEVQKDVDGDPRDTLHPDIGADEFSAIDLAALFVEPTVAKLGDNTVTVTLLNKGSLSLKDSSVSLSYSTDGGATWSAPEAFTSTALTGVGTTEKYSFTAQWNIAAAGTFTLCARINAPGLLSDKNKANDSVCTSVCVGSNGGTFTVGGASPDYPTIAAAVASLGNNPCGIGGPLVYNIRTGTYTERISIPKYTGASPAATITFQSETGNPKDVVIVSAGGASISDHHTVQLRGAAFVTLRNLTIVNSSDTNASAIHLTSGSHDNWVTGCIIKVDSVSDSTSVAAILASSFTDMFAAGQAASATVIDSNIISGGNYGIRLLGIAAHHDSGNSIFSNIVRAARTAGITTENNDIASISKNNVMMRGTNDESIGISVLNATSDYSIAANRILNAGKTGLRLTNADGISRALVANNMIGGGFKDLDSNAAFSMSNCDSVNIYYNSANFDAASFDGRTFFLTGGSNISIVNNIFSNPGGSTAYYVRTPGAVVRSNYNDYFTKGTDIANWDGPATSVAELRSVNTMDTNSISVDPKFYSSNDLHVSNRALDSKATPLAEVTVDFDGEVRGASTHPDIGADEFTPTISIDDLRVMVSGVEPWLGQNYPNPCNKLSVVSYQLPEDAAQGTFEISDMLGRVVERMSIDNSSSHIVLDASALVPGAYRYSIVTARGRIAKFMIIAR